MLPPFPASLLYALRVTLVLVVALVAAGCGDNEAAAPPPASIAVAAPHPSLLYGRVTTYGGDTFEGRLRWGGGEEAFWGDYFNGTKADNPWAEYVPAEHLLTDEAPTEVFGIAFGGGRRQIDLDRPFMVRFGDIARIEAHGQGMQAALEKKTAYDPEVRVVLKNGAVFDLDQLEAGDFDDGVRVWDARYGMVDLGSDRIRTIELLAPDTTGQAPLRLHGTVRTRHGAYTGFLQWDREMSLGSDVLTGRTAEESARFRFDQLTAVAKHPDGGAVVTLLDGSEAVLSGTRATGKRHRGIYVDDVRYGRVLVSWAAFERVDFSDGGAGPTYDAFPEPQPMAGRVVTRDGRELAGRLVFDLDEHLTVETLDAPADGVDYTIPFGLIAEIALTPGEPTAAVTLHSGEKRFLQRRSDLNPTNAGPLVFDTDDRPTYVPWPDVARIVFDPPSAMYPPVLE